MTIPAPTAGGTKPTSRLHPEFLLTGLAAALLATWPVWLHPASTLPGSMQPGILTHVWKYWWTAHAVLDLHVNPAFTPMLHHPRGLEVGYYMASFLDGLWAMPVTRLAGPIASFNVVVLVLTATGAWAVALLASRLGLARWPAVFVGVSWSLSPFHVGFLYGGAIENLSGPWFPLAGIAVLHLLEVPGPGAAPRRGVLAAAGLAACLLLEGLTTWYGGLLLALCGGALVVVLLALRRRPVVRGALLASAGLLVGGLAVLAAAHVLLPSPEPLCSVFEEIPTSRSTPPPLSTDLRLTWLLLALAGAGTRTGRACLLFALPFVADLLAAPVLFEHLPNSLSEETSLSALATDLVLLDSRRRSLPAHLLVSLAAGCGLAWLVALVGGRGWRRTALALPLIALALWAGETRLWPSQRPLPTPPFPVQAGPHARFLAEAEPGAVLDLPLIVIQETTSANECKRLRSRYLLDQTVHGQPVLTAVGTRLSYDLCALPLPDPLIGVLYERSHGNPVPLPDTWDPASMLAAGYRWVVFHPRILDEGTNRRFRADLEAVFGPPRIFDGGVRLYRVPDGPVGIAPDPEQR